MCIKYLLQSKTCIRQCSFFLYTLRPLFGCLLMTVYVYREIVTDDDFITSCSKISFSSHPGLLHGKCNSTVTKCAVLSITCKRSRRVYEYHLDNNAIPRAKDYKYMGLKVITDELRWNLHCQYQNIRHQ